MFWLCLIRKLEMFGMFFPAKLSLSAVFEALSAGMICYENWLKCFFEEESLSRPYLSTK